MRERGPQKSLAAERSFPPLPSEAAAAAELAPLAQTLLARAAEVRASAWPGGWLVVVWATLLLMAGPDAAGPYGRGMCMCACTWHGRGVCMCLAQWMVVNWATPVLMGCE